jgi:pimeloyl-ACP methyl ester carboxylesterase
MALDLPGHGQSVAQALTSVEEMAAWAATQYKRPATIVGHSMGGLIALELARSYPQLVDRLVLTGTATSIPVNPELQHAADAHDPRAVSMIVGWSYDPIARLGGHPDPGIAPALVTGRLLESELHNLGTDLRATSSYQRGAEAAAAVNVPTLVIAGAQDRMVPLASVRTLAEAISSAQLAVIESAGHMMGTETPNEVRRLLEAFLLLGLRPV